MGQLERHMALCRCRRVLSSGSLGPLRQRGDNPRRLALLRRLHVRASIRTSESNLPSFHALGIDEPGSDQIRGLRVGRDAQDLND